MMLCESFDPYSPMSTLTRGVSEDDSPAPSVTLRISVTSADMTGELRSRPEVRG
jgi:hypothetical protein